MLQLNQTEMQSLQFIIDYLSSIWLQLRFYRFSFEIFPFVEEFL
jgi:UV DNA damage repair endonuclease